MSQTIKPKGIIRQSDFPSFADRVTQQVKNATVHNAKLNARIASGDMRVRRGDFLETDPVKISRKMLNRMASKGRMTQGKTRKLLRTNPSLLRSKKYAKYKK